MTSPTLPDEFERRACELARTVDVATGGPAERLEEHIAELREQLARAHADEFPATVAWGVAVGRGATAATKARKALLEHRANIAELAAQQQDAERVLAHLKQMAAEGGLYRRIHQLCEARVKTRHSVRMMDNDAADRARDGEALYYGHREHLESLHRRLGELNRDIAALLGEHLEEAEHGALVALAA